MKRNTHIHIYMYLEALPKPGLLSLLCSCRCVGKTEDEDGALRPSHRDTLTRSNFEEHSLGFR